MENTYQQPVMEHISCVPFDPNAWGYISWGQYTPLTYTDWREETLSWKKSCYLSAHLSCFPTLTITGKDLIPFLSAIAVNNFKNFSVGRCKHMIVCTENGNVLDHGLILRTGENEATSYVAPFYLLYRAEKDGYDIQIKESTPENRAWVFQLAGPRSLEIVENAVKCDLHDLGFMRFTYGKIADRDVRILRMGMGGSLSYEVHGFGDEDGLAVYDELMRVGAAYDIKKLGVNQYVCNHTENGFPQGTIHFPGAILENPGYVEYMSKADYYYDEAASEPHGSLSDDIRDYYRNPLELGWEHMIDFNHDFTGKAALERMRDEGHRKMVTLVWNHEDMMKVFESFFEKENEPYDDMPFPLNFGIMGTAENKYFQDRVLKDGKLVGVSMWRTYTLYYRETISLCSIDAEDAEEGTEVEIVWGERGHRQINIRATVARYPFLDLAPNKDFDLETVPHYQK